MIRPGLVGWLCCLASWGTLVAADDAAVRRVADEQVRPMFDEGYAIGAAHLKAAERHLAAARQTLGDDPRLDYAYGLVLLKQLQRKAAIAQFEKAAHSGQPIAWPARQTLIVLDFSEKQYDRGFGRLETLARELTLAESEQFPEARRIDAARWIGRLLEALDQIVTPLEIRARLAACVETVQMHLTGQLAEALAQGRNAAREHAADVKERTERAAEESLLKQQQAQQELAEKLDARQAALKAEQADAAKTAEEWKAWLDSRLGQIDKELTRHEKDYTYLLNRRQSLQESILTVGREATILQSPVVPGAGPRRQFQLQQAQTQLAAYQLQLEENTLQLAKIVETATAVLQRRAAIVQRYETATGELVQRNAKLKAWDARATAQQQQLAKAPAKAKKPTGATRAAKSLRSFIGLDFVAERDSVLASLGLAACE